MLTFGGKYHVKFIRQAVIGYFRARVFLKDVVDRIEKTEPVGLSAPKLINLYPEPLQFGYKCGKIIIFEKSHPVVSRKEKKDLNRQKAGAICRTEYSRAQMLWQ